MVLIVAIIVSQLCLAERLVMLRKMINLPSVDFLKEVYLNVILVMLLSCLFPAILSHYLEESFISFIIVSIVSVATTLIVIYIVGCKDTERQFAKDKLKILKSKIIKK